jgi:hypothetical protein
VPTAILGQNYTFHALFLDADNNPRTLLGPTAKVFRFNSAGVEVTVSSGSMSAVTGDAGRYEYTFTVPLTLSAGDTLFAVMSGQDSITLDMLVAESNVDVINNPQQAGGLNARFIP